MYIWLTYIYIYTYTYLYIYIYFFCMPSHQPCHTTPNSAISPGHLSRLGAACLRRRSWSTSVKWQCTSTWRLMGIAGSWNQVKDQKIKKYWRGKESQHSQHALNVFFSIFRVPLRLAFRLALKTIWMPENSKNMIEKNWAPSKIAFRLDHKAIWVHRKTILRAPWRLKDFFLSFQLLLLTSDDNP